MSDHHRRLGAGFHRWLDQGEPVTAQYVGFDYRYQGSIPPVTPSWYERLEADRDFRLHDAVRILSGRCGYSMSVFQQDECAASKKVDRDHGDQGRRRKRR